ncbi:MAG TPA: DUF484 family protein [Acidiferrobacteraceae bacterium]|nr:DUF484 family protein [Acidiferrobacteraceae bacterium]
MREEQNTETSPELQWEETVARYLDEHPDYFKNHPEILMQLHIPHEGCGVSISLIEKQVDVLRIKNRAMQRQLHDLMTIARENSVAGERLHRLCLILNEASSAEKLLRVTHDQLRKDFKLETNCLVCNGDNEALAKVGAEIIYPESDLVHHLLNWMGETRVRCDDHPDSVVMETLFVDSAEAIASVAFIALGSGAPWGVLVLASSDKHRFHPGIGTVYLGRLGEVLSSAFQRFRS